MFVQIPYLLYTVADRLPHVLLLLFFLTPFKLKNKSGQLILNVVVQGMIKSRACVLFPPPFTAIPHPEYQQLQLASFVTHAGECVEFMCVCVCVCNYKQKRGA